MTAAHRDQYVAAVATRWDFMAVMHYDAGAAALAKLRYRLSLLPQHRSYAPNSNQQPRLHIRRTLSMSLLERK